MNIEKKRLVYMDVIRILAVCGVIYIHTGDMGYSLYATTESIVLKFIYYLFAVISEISVPLFFMVSGALLLGKEERFEDILKKRCLRIVMVLLVASLCQYAYNVWVGKVDAMTLAGYLKGILNNGFTESLWFLYSYLMYLLILPFLRMLVRQMRGKHYIYLMVLCVIFKGMTNILLQYADLELTLDIYESPTFSKIFIYPLMGYYLENVLGDAYDKKYIWGNMFLFGVTSLMVAYLSMNRSASIENFTKYDKGLFGSMLTAVIAVSAYALIRHIVKNITMSVKVQKIIQVMGANTFGVYLLERFVRENILDIYFWSEKYLTRIGAALVLVVSTFVVCEFITAILKKVPFVKRVI